MSNMICRLVAGAVLAVMPLVVAAPAAADPYKWCAVYGGQDGGGSNCGFLTLEECRATISGMGGMCQPNQFYTGPDRDAAPSKRKRK